MKAIGITGGVGTGKSEVLSYLAAHYNCRVIMADQVAKELSEPGGVCYAPLLSLLGRDILDASGRIDRGRMAAKIFQDGALRLQVNGIVHPAVKAYLCGEIAAERAAGEKDLLFIEAALLLEEGYEAILDEIWCVSAREDVRRKRLSAARGYTAEKVDAILKSQLSEREFLARCDVALENNGDLSQLYEQIQRELGEYQWQRK